MTLSVKAHESLDYAHLLDISQVDPVKVNSTEDKCLEEIGALLTKTDAYKYVGISLLHKHFDVADNELMLHDFSSDKTEIVGFPRLNIKPSSSRYSPINMKFSNDISGDISLIGLDYVASNDVDINDHLNESLLNELKQIFIKCHMSNRFGIRLLLNLDHNSETTYIEFSDSLARRSVCNLIPRSDSRLDSTIETVWQWEKTDSGFSKMDCVMCCYTSSEGHVKWC